MQHTGVPHQHAEKSSRTDPMMPEPRSRHAELAQAWRRAVLAATYIPRSPQDLDDLLTDLTGVLFDALGARDFSPSSGRLVGARLVREGFVDPAALVSSVSLLTDELIDGTTGHDRRVRRTSVLLGSMAAGFADELRKHTLNQQEEINQALLNSVMRAEKNLRATESRFQEVFVSSATGIAITDLNGMCLDANPALGQILGHRPDDLMGESIADLFRDDTAGDPLRLYRGILEGTAAGLHEQRMLRRTNGEKVWVLLAVSLLRDDTGEPAYFVTMVQDVTELRLLQERLSHQLLYDPLTGLPNRQCFHSKLESVLGAAPAGASVTLCCVNLDGFALVNNSLGHDVGDRLLQAVARHLKSAVADQNAVVARIGGDEFAVLIEDAPEPIAVNTLVDRINEELSEPEYLADRGVSVVASIGAVRRLASASPPDELFRAADIALRQAKATGRRQWAGYHEGDHVDTNQQDRWAVELPGAWETGDLKVAYEPVVALPGRALAGVRAVLRWYRASGKPLAHAECVRLAERTGLSVQLVPSILAEAAGQLPRLRSVPGTGPLVRIQLTRNQSADADLIRAVNQAITDPAQVEISLHTGAVLDDFGDARDNLEVLAEIGVGTGLCEFNGGPRELDLVERTGVRSVTLAAQHVATASTLLRAETIRMIGMIRERGVQCSVLDIGTADEAAFWAESGVTTAQGGMFGTARPATELDNLLRGNIPV